MGFWRNAIIQPALDADITTAVGEQKELLRADPSNPGPYFALGTLAYFHGDTETAIQFFLKALELDPAYAAPHASLGRIYVVQGKYELAWRHAREAERLGDPSLVQQLERYPNVGPPQEKHQDSK
jgi:tetratricopeptide (TPR) repeat protein